MKFDLIKVQLLVAGALRKDDKVIFSSERLLMSPENVSKKVHIERTEECFDIIDGFRDKTGYANDEKSRRRNYGKKVIRK